MDIHSPIQGNDRKAEHSGRTEKPVQELDGFAQQKRMDPQAAQGTGTQGYVKGHTHQPSTNARTRQVLDEEIGDRLEDIGVASAPQHCSIAWGRRDEKVKGYKPRSVPKDTTECEWDMSSLHLIVYSSSHGNEVPEGCTLI